MACRFDFRLRPFHRDRPTRMCPYRHRVEERTTNASRESQCRPALPPEPIPSSRCPAADPKCLLRRAIHSMTAHSSLFNNFPVTKCLFFFSLSRRSECSSSVYEIPPPPRSLPWLQQQQQQHRNHETDGEKRSSSQSDLLDDDSAFVGNDDCLSRSYDERSIDFLSDNQSTLPDVDRNAFKRSSHTRHSADQYLPMTAQPATKVSVSSTTAHLS